MLGALRFVLAPMLLRPEIEGVQFRVRSFRPKDFETLWRLDQLCFEVGISYSETELRHYMELKTAFTLIAETEARSVAGFIIGHRRRGGFGHVLTIDVDPQFRQQGVGSLLLGEAQDRLAREGCDIMFLETAVNNLAAIAFYKRHGYAVVRTLPRYYHATGVDAFLMSKRLDAASSKAKENPRP